MKRMTRKELHQLAEVLDCKVIQVGYCDLQYLTGYGKELGCNHGVSGWNWTAYLLGSVIVCTGYRSLTGDYIPYGFIKEWDDKASAVHDRDAANKLIEEFNKAVKAL